MSGSAFNRPATFPAPDGSAGAAHFSGAGSLARRARADALRARADPDAAHPPSRPPPRERDMGTGAPWPRPPACLTAAQLAIPPERARVAVAGLVIVRQRPGSAKGVLFITLEDETGVVNVVVWSKVYERFRRAVMAGRLLRVIGRLQREGAVTHVVAETIEDLSSLLDRLAQGGPRLSDESLANADEVRRPNERGSRPESGGAQKRAQGLIRRAAPRAAHPRAQAGLLFRDPPGTG
jgi:hypothetical protein